MTTFEQRDVPQGAQNSTIGDMPKYDATQAKQTIGNIRTIERAENFQNVLETQRSNFERYGIKVTTDGKLLLPNGVKIKDVPNSPEIAGISFSEDRKFPSNSTFTFEYKQSSTTREYYMPFVLKVVRSGNDTGYFQEQAIGQPPKKLSPLN